MKDKQARSCEKSGEQQRSLSESKSGLTKELSPGPGKRALTSLTIRDSELLWKWQFYIFHSLLFWIGAYTEVTLFLLYHCIFSCRVWIKTPNKGADGFTRECHQTFSYGCFFFSFWSIADFGLPRWFSGKESASQADVGLIPGLGQIPWRRNWQPTAVFLSEKSHGQRSLVGYSPWAHKELNQT